MTGRRSARIGVLYGIAAYGWWGLAAFYFRALGSVSPGEIMAHRIVWSLLLLLMILAIGGRLPELRAILRKPNALLPLLLSALLVSTNWLLFIWSIATDRLLDASFGYFVNPLVNMLLGFIFLGERLNRLQQISVALAGSGVVILGMGLGRPPWVAIVLALSFGFYGLLRKRSGTDSVLGLTVETLILTPLALLYLFWLQQQGRLAFLDGELLQDALLLAAGPVTALPLIWFVAAARRLRYVSVSFIQYLAPSGQFLVAVFAFGEIFTRAHAISFGLIWGALLLFSLDALRQTKTPAGVPAGV